MRKLRLFSWLSSLALILTACTVAASTSTPAVPPTSTPVLPTDTPVPPASTPTPAAPTSDPASEATSDTLLPEESPPPGAQLSFSTDFSRHSVPYDEILSGGPPKDGIPAIDAPQFVTVDEADGWLEPQEPVILVQVDDDARAYPIQILMWHEIVNDTVGGVPVSVTFCPLCNTGIAFERAFDGQVLDFGTTGRLRNSNLIMYDRQTETWWQQATGEAIVGEHTGRQLTFVPVYMIAWADFKSAHPGGRVLSRETEHDRPYGHNPYAGYDNIDSVPFLFDGQMPDGVLPMMARVLTVDLHKEAVAYPYDVLEDVHVVNDTIGGIPIVVLWAPGTTSALHAGTVAGGRDVGAATAFSRELDDQTLTFVFEDGRIVDAQTGTEWDLLGQAVSGSLVGSQLAPVVSVNHFWFSWSAFKPETRVYSPDQSTASTLPPAADSGNVELIADFDISVYQGKDMLGGEFIKFSDVFAHGKPVVLNLWAGLCPICRTEMPHLQEAYREYGDQVLIVGIDVGPFVGLGSKEDALALLDDLEITYPAGTTTDAAIMREYRVLGTPATYFLTPNGEVIEQWNGLLTSTQLYDKIDELLKASKGA